MKLSCMLYVFILAASLLQKVAGSITLTEQSVRMTLHTYKTTWNEARYICEAENMSLVEDYWLERTNVIVFFMAQTWPNLVHPWIGLHFAAPMTGSDSDREWVWSDCVIQNLTEYSNWALFEPQLPCVYYDYSDGVWYTGDCNAELEFICEKTLGPCTYVERDGQPDLSLYYQFQFISAANISECQALCLTEVLSDRNCWAVSFEGNDCKLYHTRDPFLFDSISFLSNGESSFIKRCYFGATDTVDDTPRDTNTNPDPDKMCQQFSKNRNEQTTYHNTTNTAATTTSTAVPTISMIAPTTSPVPPTLAPTTINVPVPPTSASTTTASTTSVLSVSANSVSDSIANNTSTTYSTTAAISTSSTASSIQPFSNSTTVAISTSSTASSTQPVSNTPTVVISTSSFLTSTQPVSNTTISSSGTSITTTTSICTNTLTSCSVCTCPCSDKSSSSNLTLVEKLERIITKLRVDKKQLSSTIRKKTSAEDERASAKSVGYVAILVASIELSIIVIPDLIKLTNYIFLNFLK